MNVQMNSLTGIPDTTMYLPSYINNYSMPYLQNGTMLVIILVVIIAFFSLFSSLGVSSVSTSSNVNSGGDKEVFLFEIILWGLFVFLVLVNGMSYFFNINIVASLKDILSDKPLIEISVKEETNDNIDYIQDQYMPATSIPYEKQKEVFHVPNNKYNYMDSKAICKAYGGRLANYNEINDSLGNGADWCSYGWSDDQMALYPTQYEKWKKLQKVSGHENDCGRPGINGGYIGNPEVKFGVNCYGYKPNINEKELELMRVQDEYPKTKAEMEFDKKVNYWKGKLQTVLVAPFNHSNWNMF
jgi:hypothetical protein